MTDQFGIFETLEHCPGCNSKAIGTYREPDIAECSACHLLFRNPRPTQAEIARSYNTGGTFAAWQDEEAARALMWDRRAALIRRFQPRGKLLDVGTGDGRFLQLCRSAGYDVIGTEVSETGAAYARRQGLDVRMGQVTEIDLPQASFDLITVWHVLEHVPEPRAVLAKLHSLLRPGGFLALAVPNEENFLFRDRLGRPGPARPFGPLPFGGEIHLTYFRPRTLRSTLRAAHFTPVEFGVDDLYSIRDAKMKAKLALQKTMARLLNWHFAVAMYAICKRASAA